MYYTCVAALTIVTKGSFAHRSRPWNCHTAARGIEMSEWGSLVTVAVAGIHTEECDGFHTVGMSVSVVGITGVVLWSES